jgi:hypothetical protein
MGRTKMSTLKSFAVASVLTLTLNACGVELELNCTELSLMTTETFDLMASQPGNVTSSSIFASTAWSNSDSSIVEVTQSSTDPRLATLVALQAGTSTVEVAEGADPDTCQVTVEPAAHLTISVTDEAPQMVEPHLGDLQLGVEGWNPVLDETAYFIDSGEEFTVLAPAGEHELTFWTSINWTVGGDQHRLVPAVTIEDGVAQTRTYTGDASEWEVVSD